MIQFENAHTIFTAYVSESLTDFHCRQATKYYMTVIDSDTKELPSWLSASDKSCNSKNYLSTTTVWECVLIFSTCLSRLLPYAIHLTSSQSLTIQRIELCKSREIENILLISTRSYLHLLFCYFHFLLLTIRPPLQFHYTR